MLMGRAVEKDGVEVRIELEVGGASLHHEDGAALATLGAVTAQPEAVEPEDRAHEDATHARQELPVIRDPLT
jgi:hypothetical protein